MSAFFSLSSFTQSAIKSGATVLNKILHPVVFVWHCQRAWSW